MCPANGGKANPASRRVLAFMAERRATRSERIISTGRAVQRLPIALCLGS